MNASPPDGAGSESRTATTAEFPSAAPWSLGLCHHVFGAGVPVPRSQSPAATPFLARTRTRYSVPFVRPVIDCDLVVPVRSTATQAAEASSPSASSSSPTAPVPVDEAEV